jgi:23S rRNA pseudouridine1911/1915/1917 synthase
VIGEGTDGKTPARTRFVVADDATAGQRLDRFVCAQFSSLGRAAARRLIAAGEVRLNGRPAAPGARVHAGDEVEVALAAALDPRAAQPDADAPLCVLYQDEAVVCADKPAGMPAHPLRPGERGTLASALLTRYPELAQVGYSPREPGIVHRLDTDTSGVMLAARDQAAFAALRAQLERGEIDKRYLALCAGVPAAPAVHEAWLSARGARVSVRPAQFASARRVQTELLDVQPVGAYALVTARVHVARRHQIRAHLAALGHPIAGDLVYGGPVLTGLDRHFLHASELSFMHPRTGERTTVRAPLPAELQAVLEALR